MNHLHSGWIGFWVASLLVLIPIQPPAFPASPKSPPPAPIAQECTENPEYDFQQSISAPVDGDELSIMVSARFGGAVESLKWRGKEFINIWDHGRQISYAWHMNGLGECWNPTEPGTANDGQGPRSSSQLLSVCRSVGNALTTTTQPAFWLAPGQSGYCSGGAARAVNATVISDHQLVKTIQIGADGIDNVIAFTAELTIPESYRLLQIEMPTGYLTREFSTHWVFNPATGVLTQPESQPVQAPWSFQYFGRMPPILSTPDGQFAMGVFSTDPIEGYGIYATNSPVAQDRTNKWHVVARQEPAPAGTYVFKSYVVVGTLAVVQAGMTSLYDLHPVEFDPPVGFLDVADCTEIAGWAWDPKTPDRPISVEVHGRHGDESPIVLRSAIADSHRPDLETALGDNGEHGFRFETADVVPDNRRWVLTAFAVNSQPGLPAQELTGSGVTLSCDDFAAPPQPTTAVTPASPPNQGGSLPCTSAALALVLGVLGWTQRSRHQAVGPNS